MSRPDNNGEYTQEGHPYQGTLIRELRHGLDKPVKVLADEVSIDPASLSKIETNKARMGKGLSTRIADKIGITADELSAAPLHPRLVSTKKAVQKTLSLLSLEDQISEMITGANLSIDQQKLAEQLILDTSKAIILRIGVSNER